MRCSEITSADIVSFAKTLRVSPQTVTYYVACLGSIFRLAHPAWGYPLERRTVSDALIATKDLGLTAKSRHRVRRPTLAELDQIMEHFATVKARLPSSVPMQRIIAFAIFSTRRQEEIVTIKWADYEGNRVLVRDMKNPNDKFGNNVWCELTPEASQIIEATPRRGEQIFPFYDSRDQRGVHPHLSTSRHQRFAVSRSDTKEYRGCSNWVGQFHKPLRYLVIAIGNRFNVTRTCGKAAISFQDGNG